jgi:hypothetical protein
MGSKKLLPEQKWREQAEAFKREAESCLTAESEKTYC